MTTFDWRTSANGAGTRPPPAAGGARLRILHARAEIAGQVGLSVKGLREHGHAADAAFPPSHYGIQADIPLRQTPRWRKAADLALTALSVAGRYDVYHYHFAHSLLPSRLGYLDARANARMGKTVVAEFWGSDIRLPSIETARNPYFVNAYEEDEATNRARMEAWAEITGGHVIVADRQFDAFLEPYFPFIHVVGQRVDTGRFSPASPNPETKVPVVVHAPSNKAFKGTRHVQAAVERLRAKRLPFEYVEVHGVPHEEAVEIYRRADLVIDQLCGGAHGVFAAESMSLGKPTICNMMPGLVPTYPEGLPLINANPDTITAVLEEWLQRPAERHAVGLASREYAERVHDHRAVAGRLLDAYERIARGEPPAGDPR